MVKLSRKMEYALIALKHLNIKNDGALTSAKEISTQYNISFDVVSRVLQALNQAGIVKSIQGVQGGYHLLMNLSEVSLYRLIEVIEGPLMLVKCINNVESCELVSSCNIVSPVAILNDKIIEFYKTITILDLLEPRVSHKATRIEPIATV
jgi:Rrf2 family protein